MQKFTNILVVLPCHSLEDFPIHHHGEEAANLLTNWTALWHPALIASVESKPDWHQADNPDFSYLKYSGDSDEYETSEIQSEEVQSEQDDSTPADTAANSPNAAAEPVHSQPNQTERFPLVLIPTVAEPVMDSELLQNLDELNGLVISNSDSRDEIVKAALAQSAHAQKLAEKVDPKLAQDFHALGYAFLQVQIMTRQLRYSSNLDEAFFTESLVAAAKAATAGDHKKAKSGLTRCFDTLLEEKNAYYPVEPDLLDVVLTAKTTLGNSLNRQLDIDHPINILLTGENAKTLADKSPEIYQRLKDRISSDESEPESTNDQEDTNDEPAGYFENDSENETTHDEPIIQKSTIIGGLQDELPETLVSSESLVNQLERGRETIKQLFDFEPSIFMRRRFGLTPATPGVLDQFNFAGAIHATLDDGKFPLCSSANIRWTGKDERSILAYGDAPLSAADSGSFVGFGVKLGEAIDSAHIASILFCHWPDNTCESFQDLLRITNYSPLFGTFVNIDEYFDQVYDPGYGDTFLSDEYRNPFLKQAVEEQIPNPISRVTVYWERFYKLNSCRSLLTQLCAKTPIPSEQVSKFQETICKLQTSIEAALNQSEQNDELCSQIEQLTNELTNVWSGNSKVSVRQSNSNQANPNDQDSNKPSSENSQELINTTSFRRRVTHQVKSVQSGTLKNAPPVILGDGNGEESSWVHELPPMSGTSLSHDQLGSQDQFKSDPKVVDELKLRNEFFELAVDDKTGGIRSIQQYKTRTNIVGQQLAIRIPSQRDSRNQPLTKARYTTMVVDNIETKSASRLMGSIISKGRLLDGSECLANYQQTVTLWRGKPIAEVHVEIDLQTELTKSVNHYVCSRLAWKSDTATVIANSQEDRSEVNSDWFNATNFVEVDQDGTRLLMLTGGLPFHRRSTKRMLDSLLIVGAETKRKFRIGLGVNVPYALAAATDWLTPVVLATSSSAPTTNESTWLFHFDCKNILVTNWQPIFETGADRWSGVRLRIKETEGRNGELSIRCPRPIASGQKENLTNDFLLSYDTSEEEPTKLKLEFGRYDFFQISINWKP